MTTHTQTSDNKTSTGRVTMPSSPVEISAEPSASVQRYAPQYPVVIGIGYIIDDDNRTQFSAKVMEPPTFVRRNKRAKKPAAKPATEVAVTTKADAAAVLANGGVIVPPAGGTLVTMAEGTTAEQVVDVSQTPIGDEVLGDGAGDASGTSES